MISKDDKHELVMEKWRQTFPASARTSRADINAGELLAPRYHFGETNQAGMSRDALTEPEPTTARRFTSGGPLNALKADSIFLFFDRTVVADFALKEDQANYVIPLEAARDHLTSAVADDTAKHVGVWFSIVREFETLTSETLELDVDFAPPGGIPDKSGVPPGGFVPSWRDRENEGLATIPELAQPILPGTTILNVPEWANMTAGDTVTIHWGNRTFSATVREGDEGLPFRIRVPVDVPATPVPPTVRYDIVDRFGNYSGTSRNQLDDGGVIPSDDATLDFEKADDQTVAPPSGFIDLWPNEIPAAQWNQANKLMQVGFDTNGFTHDRDVKIDVHQSSVSSPGQYGGKLLTVGNPQFAGLEVRAFLTLSQAWTTVSFYMTSVDNPLEIHFQDASGQTLHRQSVPGGNVTTGHFVSYTAAAPSIKRISVRCKEVIRLDNFQFKGRAR